MNHVIDGISIWCTDDVLYACFTGRFGTAGPCWDSILVHLNCCPASFLSLRSEQVPDILPYSILALLNIFKTHGFLWLKNKSKLCDKEHLGVRLLTLTSEYEKGNSCYDIFSLDFSGFTKYCFCKYRQSMYSNLVTPPRHLSSRNSLEPECQYEFLASIIHLLTWCFFHVYDLQQSMNWKQHFNKEKKSSK